MRDPLSPDAPSFPDAKPRPESLRIGVNLFPLALAGGGMRQYVLHLLPWMVRRRRIGSCSSTGAGGIVGRPAAARPSSRGAQSSPPYLLRGPGPDLGQAHHFDVFFCPLNCLAPDLLDRPTVATLADIQERFFPHYFTPLERQIRAELYPHTAHAATILLTISQFSKDSICSAFGVPPEKIVVTPLSPGVVDVEANWPADLPPLPEKYFFYPANLYPHKNHILLLDALRLLRDRGVDCACVLTGQSVQPGVDIHRETASRGLDDRVTCLGHV